MPESKRQNQRLSGEDRRRQIAEAALVCLQEVGHAGLTARRVAASGP